MRSVTSLSVDANRFAGALPDVGLRALTQLQVLSVGNNCIQGHMSQTRCLLFLLFRLLHCSSELSHPLLDQKLQSGICAPNHRTTLRGSFGAIPSSLHPDVAYLSSNLLAGAIPERLLGGQKKNANRVYIIANALDGLDVHHSNMNHHAKTLAGSVV
eukprot:2062131-Amphidinium_carterae.2